MLPYSFRRIRSCRLKDQIQRIPNSPSGADAGDCGCGSNNPCGASCGCGQVLFPCGTNAGMRELSEVQDQPGIMPEEQKHPGGSLGVVQPNPPTAPSGQHELSDGVANTGTGGSTCRAMHAAASPVEKPKESLGQFELFGEGV
mmetsp:Transcript_123987/g.246889  ORF Transcript_123987/g.246889 Transcript_123987/m.246889 type:complete len:143 (+) Transcript_123987:29-457(+)